MAKNTKSKGNAFEKYICRKLSLWWTEGKDDNVFWRTSNSGGRATVRSKASKSSRHHHGDICALDSVGEAFCRVLVVELKRGYNSSTICDLLDRSPGAKEQQYEEWIRKVCKSQELSGARAWMIIHRRDRRECLVHIPSSLYGELIGNGAFENIPGVIPKAKFYLELNGKYTPVTTMSLDDIIKGVDPQLIKNMDRSPDAGNNPSA